MLLMPDPESARMDPFTDEPTLLLTTWATLIAVLIGVPAGIVAARYHNSAVDQSLKVRKQKLDAWQKAQKLRDQAA